MARKAKNQSDSEHTGDVSNIGILPTLEPLMQENKSDSPVFTGKIMHTPTPLRSGMKLIERDQHGLVLDVEYKFNNEGRVDWKKMIPSQFLYVNSDPSRKDKIEKKYGKNIKEIDVNLDNVEDTDLVVKLGGLKYLLFLRGYTKVNHTVSNSSDHYASVTCSIDFIPNFESCGATTFCENGSAHFGSTSSFGRAYLLEIATNRAFCRCIRNALQISVVSAEELGANVDFGKNETATQPISNGSVYTILESKCNEKNFSFAKTKVAAMNYKAELEGNPELWAKWSDISPTDCYVLLGKIKAAKG